jgi:hypothetical protein
VVRQDGVRIILHGDREAKLAILAHVLGGNR